MTSNPAADAIDQQALRLHRDVQMLNATEGFAYFAWHRLTWNHNLCTGIRGGRLCVLRWVNGYRR